MRLIPFALWSVCGASLPTLGCVEEPPPEPSVFILNIESDPGQPLAGAKVFVGKHQIGASDAAGRVPVRAHGKEGSSIQLNVECPDGYQAPPKPVAATFRSGDRNRPPQFKVHCAATSRAVVVAVRAVNGPDLTILHLGQAVARTDAQGAAHVHLRATPGDAVQLQIDTTARADLKPQNPTQNFAVPAKDQLFIFDHEFITDKPKRVVRAGAPKKGNDGPVRLRPR